MMTSYIRNFIDSRKDKKEQTGDLCPSETEGRGYEPRQKSIMEEMYEEHSDQEAIRELLRKKHWD